MSAASTNPRHAPLPLKWVTARVTGVQSLFQLLGAGLLLCVRYLEMKAG